MKTYSLREVAQLQRQAFTDGATFELKAWQHMQRVNYCSGADSIAEAQRRYPLPKVTRPRVVHDRTGGAGDCEWRYVNGALQWRRPDGGEWRQASPESSGMFIYAERVKILADLLANPNETVEDECQ